MAKTISDALQRQQQLAIYRDGLLNDTLPFWLNHAYDRECGGFMTFLDADGSVVSTDKPMWIIGRITWLFARLCNNVEPRKDWQDAARHGLNFLLQHGFDHDGRMFYAVTREGLPLRKRRYLFTEAFAVIALAECSRALNEPALLKQAKDLFELMLHFHSTPGLLEPKTFVSTRPLKSHAMPMILLATAQVLRQADPQASLDSMIQNWIDEVLNDFVKPQWQVLLENVGPSGEFLDEPPGREVNPGHAIETAWFMLEEARHRQNDTTLINHACQIIDWSLAIGWDESFGGLFYFRDCKGKPCPQYEHDMKLWWPHAEAIYATLLAYHLTRESRFADWHQRIHDWAYAHFPDPQHGEWFGYLHRDGTLASSLKGNMWKGPFHLPRMQLNCWQLLENMTEDTP